MTEDVVLSAPSWELEALVSRLSSRDGCAPGTGREPSDEKIRFRSDLSLEFPRDDIARVVPPRTRDEAWTIETRLPGLYGNLGTLSRFDTETLLRLEAERRPATRALLDALQSRTLAFAFRTAARYRSRLTDGAWPELADLIAGLLGAHRTEIETGRLPLLGVAAPLRGGGRSHRQVERLLERAFGLRARATGVERRTPLDPEERTRLGPNGSRLGRNTGLGARVFRPALRLDVRLSDREELARFERIRAEVEEFLGRVVGPTTRLVWRSHLPAAALRSRLAGHERAMRIGRTAWLASTHDRNAAIEYTPFESRVRRRRVVF